MKINNLAAFGRLFLLAIALVGASPALAVEVCPVWLKGYQFNDANGTPLSSGTIKITNEGTDSLLTTYSNRQGTTPNTLDGSNRIPLTSSGKLNESIYVPVSNFKFVLKDLSGTTIDSEDSIKGCLDTSGFLTSSVTAETPVITKTGDYTVLTTDQGKIISSNPTGGSFTLTLPSAVTAGDGWRVTIKHSGTANTVTVQTVSSQTINGSGTSRVLSTRDESFTLVSDGANWHTDGYGISKLTHGKFFGRTTTADGPPEVMVVPFAQVQLAKSGSNLVLSPKNGNLLTIDGKAEVVPSSGVSLSASGLNNSTLYYTYAYMNSGTMTLEALTAAYTTDTTSGMPIKSGDSTRTLVGICYLAAGAFVDSETQRYVRSYFNDPGVQLRSKFTADRSTTSTVLSEVNTEIRVEFIAWSDELVVAQAQGGQSDNAGGILMTTAVGFDGGSEEGVTRSSAVTAVIPWYVVALTQISTGYHYATLMSSVASNTGTYTGGSLQSKRTSLIVRLKR